MLGTKKIAEAAKDLADYLQILESIKSLQAGQKQIADAIRALDDRIRGLEIELKVSKSEAKVDALRETQSIVNAVQGGLNQRLEDLAVKVAVIERDVSRRHMESGIPLVLRKDNELPPPADGHTP